MMYPYMTLEDGTEVICSQIIPQEDIDTVLVHFERPTARVSTPRAASFPAMNGRAGGAFSDDELKGFEKYLRSNTHLIYRHAAGKGAGAS